MQPMSAAQATTFERVSPANFLLLSAAAAARGCACAPYQDWYTFRRWRAQARHVRKGEHGIALYGEGMGRYGFNPAILVRTSRDVSRPVGWKEDK